MSARLLTSPRELRLRFFLDVAHQFGYKKDVQVRLDVASVLDPGPAEAITDSTKAHSGDWRGHFNIIVGF